MKTKRLFTFVVAVMMIFGVISPVSAETVTVETEIGNYDKTFDSYADFAALQAADSNWTITSGAVTLEAEAGTESNKAIKYTNVNKTYAKSKYMFASPISSGILKISFKTKGLAVRFCPTVFGSNGTSQAYLGRISSTRSAVCAGSWGDPTDTSLTYNAAIDGDKWYTWEVTVDLDAATVTKDVDIKDSEGTVIASRRNYSIMSAADTSAKFASFTGFGIMNGDNVTENTEVYLDDLVIEVTLPAPEVTASSVTLENVSGETVDRLTDISPDIKKINIDFGIDVDDATISADTVKLVKDGETDGVSYKGKYADNVYTMVLDEILDGSSTYNLFVSKDITNMQRTGMESDANIGITTGKARFDVTINSIVISDAEVANIAGLTEGESATINVGYSNSTKTEKPVCVIVAYYSGTLLTGVDYVNNLSVSATDYTGTLAIPHTVLSTTDVDLVKVMVWDGLGTMRSLTTSYPVSAQ
ncbi:MAG: hypothetical protein SPH44_04190 [Eubacteriales bacterium]|nr:hypothetical protein [Eubacteriales bacterium]